MLITFFSKNALLLNFSEPFEVFEKVYFHIFKFAKINDFPVNLGTNLNANQISKKVNCSKN